MTSSRRLIEPTDDAVTPLHTAQSNSTSSSPSAPASPSGPLDPPTDDITIITQRSSSGGTQAASPRTTHSLSQLLAGERLNHFELLEFVGGGGMGAVFKARDTVLNRIVALKVLSNTQATDEETRRRFQNEAQSAARLDHENVARVYYIGEDKGLYYIVFEYVEGVNLRQVVERTGGPLPTSDVVSYTIQVARALEHAAAREVVHRDIKPSNIIITADGKAKLVDMGLARLHDVDQGSADLTASGVTLGTFDYISPEQARDPRSADVRSDLYSLGCTMFFLLTARPPFPTGTVLQKLLQHNNEPPPDVRQFNDLVGDALAAIVAKLLSKNPQRRYQTPRDLIFDLIRLAESEDLPLGDLGLTPLLGVPLHPPGFFERHAHWLVPVSLLLLLIIGIEVFDGSNTSLALPTVSELPKPIEPPVSAPPIENVALDTSAKGTVDNNPPEANNTGTTRDLFPGEMSKEPAKVVTKPIEVVPDEPPPLRSGLLVVAPGASGPQQFNTLRAACQSAANGDVIELRYSGIRNERPIELKNRKLTIRAGEGFQPVIRFQPDDVDPLRYPRMMFTVLGGRLSLINVAVQLDVPAPRDVPAESWSLFESQRSELVELKSCVLTVRNLSSHNQSLHPGVSFFSVRAADGFAAMMADDKNPDEPPQIRLENCVARGEAVFLRTGDLQSVNLSWDNGLCVTPDRFCEIFGGQVMPRPETRVQISLRHLTVAVGSGFARFNGGLESPYLCDTSIECKDSILLALNRQPLIEEEGIEGIPALQKHVHWSGERNFYQGFDTDALWRIADQVSPGQVVRLNQAQWQEHWGNNRELQSAFSDVTWKHLPDSLRPAHQQLPFDYALAESAGGNNSARQGASDGTDVGQALPLLPDVLPAADKNPDSPNAIGTLPTPP